MVRWLLVSDVVSDAMDMGDVGGVSNDESEGERCNLKSLGRGPEIDKKGE